MTTLGKGWKAEVRRMSHAGDAGDWRKCAWVLNLSVSIRAIRGCSGLFQRFPEGCWGAGRSCDGGESHAGPPTTRRLTARMSRVERRELMEAK